MCAFVLSFVGGHLNTFLPIAALHGAKTQYRTTPRNTTNVASVTFRVLFSAEKEQADEVSNQDCEAQP